MSNCAIKTKKENYRRKNFTSPTTQPSNNTTMAYPIATIFSAIVSTAANGIQWINRECQAIFEWTKEAPEIDVAEEAQPGLGGQDMADAEDARREKRVRFAEELVEIRLFLSESDEDLNYIVVVPMRNEEHPVNDEYPTEDKRESEKDINGGYPSESNEYSMEYSGELSSQDGDAM